MPPSMMPGFYAEKVVCSKEHGSDNEIFSRVQRSKDKSCGICFDVILEKSRMNQKFGILPNCYHCFCFNCIMKWRREKNFDRKIVRSCPECRIASDFVYPSSYWVDNKEDKDKLISDHKKMLSCTDCKYFRKGAGKCPYGNTCFYLHACPDGTKVDVGPRVRRRRQSTVEVFERILLMDFPESHWGYPNFEDLDDIFDFFTDSDDSEWSDYDFLFD